MLEGTVWGFTTKAGRSEGARSSPSHPSEQTALVLGAELLFWGSSAAVYRTICSWRVSTLVILLVMLPSSQTGDFWVEGDAKRGIYDHCSCAWTCAVGQTSSLRPAELTLLPVKGNARRAVRGVAPRSWSLSSLLQSALEKALGSSYSDLQSFCHALNA